MPLVQDIITLFVMWWFLSLFFRRIPSPLRPVVR
jgi:hypothetical protein